MNANAVIIALRNVFRSRLKLGLTILSVAIGIASVLLISSVGYSGKNMILSSLESIGAKGLMFYQPSGQTSGSFDEKSVEDIRRSVRGVTGAMPFTTKYGVFQFSKASKDVVVWGIGEKSDLYLDVKLLYGRLPSGADCKGGEKVVVISSDMAREAYNRVNVVGKKITLKMGGVEGKYKVIGVIDSKDQLFNGLLEGQIPSFVYVPYTTLRKETGTGADRLIVVYDKALTNAKRVTTQVYHVVKNSVGSGISLEVSNLDEDRAQIDYIASILTMILSATAAVSLLVAGIGVMNTMLTTVAERRREIGICKAIGARNGQIAFGYLVEAAVITLIGGILGVGGGLLVTLGVFFVLGFTPVFHPTFILSAVCVTVTTGILFGVVPAVRASKLDPILALKEDH